MVAERHLVLLAALAVVGGAAKYDIFQVVEALTMLTKDDLIARIKVAEDAYRLNKTRDNVMKMNGPLYRKFQIFRAQLNTLSRDEQNVIGRLLSIARDVLDHRINDYVSDRIVEAFRNGGQGLCAKYPRLPAELCSAVPHISGGHPAAPGSSVSTDENFEALIDALTKASSTSSAKLQLP
ncbi:unnamed protein product [Nippostrongylus brasiliensis]|uniref:Conserved secreted protein n=1 Tax=Nippostrongylus brasiliensis TaxID=27835 RepID=A0A0N4XWQ0_NIPBR|nr:unnamed protein product [Nippostrongylus brasiliensis]